MLGSGIGIGYGIFGGGNGNGNGKNNDVSSSCRYLLLEERKRTPRPMLPSDNLLVAG